MSYYYNYPFVNNIYYAFHKQTEHLPYIYMHTSYIQVSMTTLICSNTKASKTYMYSDHKAMNILNKKTTSQTGLKPV